MSRIASVVPALVGFALAMASDLQSIAAEISRPSELGGSLSTPKADEMGPLRPPVAKAKLLLGSGSGFFIAADKLVTNFHVVKGCGALSVGNNTEGAEVNAQIVAADDAADLALLSAKPPDAVPAQFRLTPPEEPRDEFAIVGYPEHGLPVLEAELDRITVFQDDIQPDQPRYQFFGPVRRGNSGGPLLDWTGAVVGVAVQKVDTVTVYKKTGLVVDDLGVAIANGTVFRFLEAHDTPFEAAAAGETLSADDLLLKAHGFVRQVRCWR